MRQPVNCVNPSTRLAVSARLTAPPPLFRRAGPADVTSACGQTPTPPSHIKTTGYRACVSANDSSQHPSHRAPTQGARSSATMPTRTALYSLRSRPMSASPSSYTALSSLYGRHLVRNFRVGKQKTDRSATRDTSHPSNVAQLSQRRVRAALMIRSAVRRLVSHSAARSTAEGWPPERSSASTRASRSSSA
jgi:hypothetical protein